jgi:phosphoglucomutase
MAFCEAAAYYYKRNMTLWDAILEMYEKYGYFEDKVIAITHQGKEGLDLIQNIMIELRKNPPKQIGAYPVKKFVDYSKGIDEIPVSNVLQFDLGEGVWLAIRPSGTEPKIKLYFGVIGENLGDARQKSSDLEKAVTGSLESVSK